MIRLPDLRRRPHREDGSAYIVTLLALVVLTILGLSLSLVTQSELVIGANERVEKRTFYAADSGLSRAIARLLVNGESPAMVFAMDDAGSSLPGVRYDVAVSRLQAISFHPCNLCQINNAGEYGALNLQAITFSATSTASRVRGTSGASLAEKVVTGMATIQPKEATPENLQPAG